MKDAYYFSHDSNARNDQRLIKLRMKYGMEGYGIYFGIIEILREQEDYILFDSDVNGIAYDLRIEPKQLEDIIHNYNLFQWREDDTQKEPYFYSSSLSRRMCKLDNIRAKRKEYGKRGGRPKAKEKHMVLQETESEKASVKQVKESKVKDSKVKDNKEKKIIIKNGKFKNEVFEFKNKYDEDMLNEFIDYWTEPNKSLTKLRYEMESTWSLEKRLARWANSNYNMNKSPSQRFQQNGTLDAEITQRNKNLAEQSKLYSRYMEEAKKDAAEPTEIKQILGQAIRKLKPRTKEEEVGDGQQKLHRD